MAEIVNQTREALLEAAERLFSSRGYAAVGTREIAEQAGANLASIKYHFGSKHDLYLETVRRAMETHGGEEVTGELAGAASDRQEAALKLARFIRAFFARAAEHPGMDACGLLIIREALQPSEAIDAVVRDYLQPCAGDVIGVLKVLLPEASNAELHRYSELVFGQLLHHRVFRPFIERLGAIDLSDKAVADKVARQAAAFSLRGLGCDEAMIRQALDGLGGDP